jgi:hypothetical protein
VILEMPWSRAFDVPISLPSGGTITTLKDAALYVVALPKAEKKLDHWQTAAAALMVAAERGEMMLAEIAMRQALLHGQPEVPPAPRKRAARIIR